MQPLSKTIAKVTSRNFSKKYIAIGRIVEEWENIVGADLANKAQPLKINYRKGKKRGKAYASLDIATSAANATTMHYQKDLILQRINRIFGEGWITSIRFVTFLDDSQDFQPVKPEISLSEEEKNYLSSSLGTIEDQEIKERLKSLGQKIIKRTKT